jgi:tetratricopeptide (TPR) repeat protein
MANRFCASCGARLLRDANFCVECGERQPGASAPRVRFSVPVNRYAPLFVVLAVLLVGGGAVFYGTLNPKTPASVPRRDAPAASGTAAGGNLPQGHPPLEIPDQVKQAMRDMAQKAAVAPDDLDAWKRLAEVQYRAGQIDASYLTEAATTYKHVLEREPDNLEVIRNLGNIAFDQEQPDAAVGYYQRYLKLKPDDLSVQTDLATMHLSAGKAEEAIQAYQAVLKADPSFFQAQFNLAIAYRTLGDSDKTAAALEKARGMAPDDTTRNQVDQLLARAKGLPPPAAPMPQAAAPAAPALAGQGPAGSAPAGQAPAAAASGGTFKADAETVFRSNPILGPKLQRIEWTGPESAKVYMRDFPMDQMGDGMRTMFADRMRGRIKEKKEAYKVTAQTKFEMVDEASGRVMETITE